MKTFALYVNNHIIFRIIPVVCVIEIMVCLLKESNAYSALVIVFHVKTKIFVLIAIKVIILIIIINAISVLVTALNVKIKTIALYAKSLTIYKIKVVDYVISIMACLSMAYNAYNVLLIVFNV